MPEMRTGHVEMVSVEWLLNNIVYSVDGFDSYDENDNKAVDFEGMISYKASDGHIGALTNTIVKHGFQVPICLYNPFGDERIGLGNGHHRLAIAILLVLDQIPVYWSDGDYMSTHATDTKEFDYDEGDYADMWAFF